MGSQTTRRAGSGWAMGLAVSLAACGGVAERGDAPQALSAPDGGSTAAAMPASPSRPETRRDTLWVEGLAEPVTLHLFRTPADFPLAFTTYLPPEMTAVQLSATDPEVRFVAEFGGVRNDGAYLGVVVPRGEVSVQEAAGRARALAESFGQAQRRSGQPGYPWAREWYGFEGPDGAVGHVLMAARGERPFLVVVRHPAEMGDGMSPRVQTMLEEWRWADGAPLAPG